MTSLGQTLAKNIAVEILNTVDPAVLAEQKRQARIHELNEAGSRFFAKAKQYFTLGIMSQTPTSSLRLQVGGEGYVKADDYHEEIRAEMDWIFKDGHRVAACGPIPTSMTDPDRFAASWEEFKRWANSNDLEAYWQIGVRAYGPSSWWFLRVSPVTTDIQQ